MRYVTHLANLADRLEQVGKLAKRVGTRELVAGGIPAAVLIAVIGVLIASGGSAQNMADARAALVGIASPQSRDITASVGGQDEEQSPVEAASTAVPVEPTPAPTAQPSPVAPPTTRGGTRVPPVTVAIDPGHGGWDSGAVYNDPAGRVFTEKEANLQVALRVQKLLTADGFNVVMTRTSDTSVGGSTKGAVGADLQGRIDIANAANADIFVSIHFNASSNPASQGTEVLYNADRPYAAQNLKLARYLDSALVSTMKAAGYASPNRGVKTDVSVEKAPLYLLGTASYIPRPSRMPAALGEALFITNPNEAALMKKPEFLDTLAQAYEGAIVAYFNQ